MKFEKDRTYTYDEIKKIVEMGIDETTNNPVGKKDDKCKEKWGDRYVETKFTMSLTGIILFNTLMENIFKESKDETIRNN